MPRPDVKEYIGLSLPEARAKAEKAGLKSRVKFKNGISQMVTQDAIFDRLNFSVDNGEVTAVTFG